ncbi:MAG: hypothetical protein WBH77_00650 [Saccharofermentanales bacterium]
MKKTLYIMKAVFVISLVSIMIFSLLSSCSAGQKDTGDKLVKNKESIAETADKTVTGSEDRTEFNSEIETETQPETFSETETQPETFSGTEIQSESPTQTESRSETQTESETPETFRESPEKTTTQSEPGDQSEIENRSNLITIFPSEQSAEFKALDSADQTITFLDNTMGPELARPIRFRIESDDVTVTLEYGDLIVNLMYFHPTLEVFQATGNQGDLYEFNGFLTESIPNFRLVCTKGDYRSEWFLAYNGREEEVEIVIPQEKWQPEDLTLDSPFMDFCKMYAYTQFEYDEACLIFGADTKSGYFYETDHYYWSCLAKLVNLQQPFPYEPDPDTPTLPLEQWLFDEYVLSLYGHLNQEIPEYDGYLVNYAPDRHEKYEIVRLTDLEHAGYLLDITSSEEVSPGKWEVEILLEDENSGLKINYLITVLQKQEYRENDPFGFVIGGIERQEVEQPA